MNTKSETQRSLMRRLKEGFLGGFLILSCVIFIIGFMTGIVAISLVPAKPDFAAFGFAVFAFGFLIGMVTIVLLQVIIKLNEMTKQPKSS